MWNRTSRWALAAGLVLAVAAVAFSLRDARSAQALTNCSTTSEAINTAEQSLGEQLNAYRAQNGLAPLAISPNLSRAAAFITEDMAAKGYFNHFEPSGRSPFQRAVDCGYPSQNIGENLANSFSSSGAMALWKSSPGHNAAMLMSKWKVVGIGQAGGYWALVFGVADDSGGSGPPPPASTQSPTATATPSPTPNPNGPSLVPIRRAMLQMVASE